MSFETEREAKGRAMLLDLFGTEPKAGPASNEMLEISKGHLFGEIWTRPGLGTRDREIVTITSIATLGRERQLRLHLKGALNAGLSRDEIVEAFMHLAYYAGYPTCFTALAIAQEVFDEIDNRGDASE